MHFAASNGSHGPQKLRGIIVVDGTELNSLSHPVQPDTIIKDSKLAESRYETGSYLDLLSLLALQGFRIVIPEMVACESASVLLSSEGGINLGTFFPKTPPKYPTEPAVVTFLMNVLDGRYPGIAVAPAHGEEKYAKYLRKLREIATRKYGHNINDPVAYRRLQLKEFQLDNPVAGKGLGQMHDLDVVREELTASEKEHTPVFFLSTNFLARSALNHHIEDAQQARTNEVTALGILYALTMDRSITDGKNEATSALQLSGLQGDAKSHWKWIRQKYNQNTGFSLPYYHEDAYNDKPLGDWDNVHRPFAESIQGLAQGLADQQEATQRETELVPKQPSRIERFRTREAKGEKIRRRSDGDQPSKIR